MRLSLRVTLSSILVALLVSVVAVTGTLSYVNGRANARDLSAQVLEQTSRRIDLWIDTLLSTARDQNTLTLRLMEAGRLDPGNFTDLGLYWLEVMQVHRSLTFLSIGIEGTGDMLYVQRLHDGRLTMRELKRNKALGTLELSDYWPEDFAARKPYNTKADHPEGDPTKRPWYVQTKAAGHPLWTETYTFLGEGGVATVTGVTCTMPVILPDGALRGVLTADYDIFDVSEFLAANPVGREGMAFIVEQRSDGELRVISHPTPGILTRVFENDQGIRQYSLVPAAELADKRVVAFMKHLRAMDLAAASSLTTFELSDGQEPYIGAYRRLTGGNVPPWLIALVIPRAEIMGRVEHNNRLTIAVGLVSFFLALLASLWISSRFSRPLRRIALESEAVGHFDLDGKPLDRSIIREVDRLVVATEDMKRSLRSFRKYVPADLVREILSTGQEAVLGGRRERLTIMFSDVAGFTTISETLPPEKLVGFMGEYFEETTRVIANEHGTIGGYQGDGIIAFWGAPSPNTTHALDACRAAVRMQERLAQLRGRWREEGKPDFNTRIGINTGEVVVGNQGSATRFDYTVNGDSVNTASRLEGLGKHYGTAITISEHTMRDVEEQVVARPIDVVSVKGKSKGLKVYELIGLKGEVPQDREAAAKVYGAGLVAYLERKWDEAENAFGKTLAMLPGDVPATIMIERCRRYRETPPPDGWDGVHRMAEK